MEDRSQSSITVSRSFEVPADRVFDAWVNPAQVRQWLFRTPAGEIVRCDIDARPGGSMIVVDRRDGEDVEHIGEYVEVDRPRRLAFDFAVPKYSSVQTRVSVDITSHGAECVVTLTHEGVLPEWRGQSVAGWTMLLDRLAETLV